MWAVATFAHLGEAGSVVCRILPKPLLRAFAEGLLPSASVVQRL